jgi:hypothetical protein
MSLELFPDIVPRKKPITPKVIGTRDSVFLGGVRKKKKTYFIHNINYFSLGTGLGVH